MSYLSRKFLAEIRENDRTLKDPFSKIIATGIRCVYQPSVDTANVEKTSNSIAFGTKAKILFPRPYKIDISKVKRGQMVVITNHEGIKTGEYIIADTLAGNNHFVVVLDKRDNG